MAIGMMLGLILCVIWGIGTYLFLKDFKRQLEREIERAMKEAERDESMGR